MCLFLISCSYTITPRQESELHLSDLLLENVTLRDNGTYKCVANNSVGPGDKAGEPTLIVQGMARELANKSTVVVVQMMILLRLSRLILMVYLNPLQTCQKLI